jgi:hypothetical protein
MRRSVRPGLESLEDRLTPSTFTPTTLAQSSGGMKVQAMSAPTTTPAPPPTSQGQALLSLFIDGAYLQLLRLQFEFIPAADAGALDQPDKQSMVIADAKANAAAASVNFDAAMSLFGALGRLTGRTLDTAKADIPNR